ncbi:MAG: hypothetical protein KC493_07010 [Bacteriovoracaceae bacterium]|nr:hypothetical protein [Bacteriovoracaceae bacterium]
MVLNKERTGVDKKFFELCSRIVHEENLDLYDLEYIHGSHQLRIYIQDPETGTAVLDDCIKIDRAMTPFIDNEEWMPAELTLEVSSPGLYRQIRSLEHFKSAIDQKVKLVLTKKLGDLYPELELSKKELSAKSVIVKLLEVTDEEISIEIENKKLTMKYDWIKKANLETELDNY